LVFSDVKKITCLTIQLTVGTYFSSADFLLFMALPKQAWHCSSEKFENLCMSVHGSVYPFIYVRQLTIVLSSCLPFFLSSSKRGNLFFNCYLIENSRVGKNIFRL